MIARKQLLQALSVVEPALAKQERVPAFQHYLFTGTHVVAYNGRIAISTPRHSKFVGCVPANLATALKNSRAPVVDLRNKGTGEAVLRLGKAQVVLPILPANAYPFQLPPPPKRSPAIDAEFVAAIAHCLRSMNLEEATAPDQQGVTLVPNGGSLGLYATDRKTMSRVVLKPSPIILKRRVILSGEFCQQLVRLAKQAHVTRLALSDHAPLFVADDAVLYGQFISSDNPLDFEAVVQRLPPDWCEALVPIPKPKLGLMIERSVRLGEFKSDTVCTEIACKDGELSFASQSNRGQAIDSVKLPDHGDVELTARATLLQRGYAAADRILFNKHVIVMATGDWLYLVSTKASGGNEQLSK